MKLKTIEIQQTGIKNIRLIKEIGKLMKYSDFWHFFYEPELIVRVEIKKVRQIKEFLKSKKLSFKVYDYPFPKDKKGYGQGSKSRDIVTTYFDYFVYIFTV